MSNSGEDSTPSDVIAIDRLLATAGIERYEPRVINQLLEVAARMTRELLVDADDIREHGRNQVQPTRHPVDVKEIEAADALRAFSTYTAPTITQAREASARARNAVPLPRVPARAGLILPPEPVSAGLAESFNVTLPPAAPGAPGGVAGAP